MGSPDRRDSARSASFSQVLNLRRKQQSSQDKQEAVPPEEKKRQMRSPKRAETMSNRRSQEIRKLEASILMPHLTPNRIRPMSKPGSFCAEIFKELPSEMDGSMSQGELAIVYYVANLMLLEQYEQADSIIEK